MDSEADVKGWLRSGRAAKESEVYYEVIEVTASRPPSLIRILAYFQVPSQENPKHEFRNPNFERTRQISKGKIQNNKSLFQKSKYEIGFDHWNLGHLNLFRISGFVFRVSKLWKS